MPPRIPPNQVPRYAPIVLSESQTGGVAGVTLQAVRCSRCGHFYGVTHVRDARCYLVVCPLCGGRRARARAAVRRIRNRDRMRISRAAAKAAA